MTRVCVDTAAIADVLVEVPPLSEPPRRYPSGVEPR